MTRFTGAAAIEPAAADPAVVEETKK